MTSMLTYFFIFLVSWPLWAAPRCNKIFAIYTAKYSSQPVFSGYFKTDRVTHRQLFVKIEKPLNGKQPKEWLFLVHGLLESHRGWDQIKTLALKNGYGVVRVDLHGHAKTLDANLKTYGELNDSITHYQTNVKDIIFVLRKLHRDFKISKPHMIGHSYGGGIIKALMSDSSGKKLLGKQVTLIAPYVYRIDGFLAENHIHQMGGSFFLSFMKDFIPPEVRDQIESLTTDPYVDGILENAYRDHYTKTFEREFPKYKKTRISKLKNTKLREKRLAEREELIERQVEAAIEITKGIRDFDSRQEVNSFPDDISVKIIVAGQDKVIPAELIFDFYKRLSEKNKNVELIELPDAEHMLITEQPLEVFNLITD